MEQEGIDNKQIELLEDSLKQILSLRRENSIYSARLQMFDDMMLLLRTQPSWGGSVSRGDDIVFRIESYISNLQSKPIKPE